MLALLSDTDCLPDSVDLDAQDFQACLAPECLGGGQAQAQGSAGKGERMEWLIGAVRCWYRAKEIVQVVVDEVRGGGLENPVQSLGKEIEEPRRATAAKGEAGLHVEPTFKRKAK